MTELLSPAGSPEKFEIALDYGADAVYLAGKRFGLRAFSQNFTDEELAKAVKTAHEKGRKVYVTLNIFAYDTDFSEIGEYAVFLSNVGVDAVIVSDLGVIAYLRKKVPQLDIHVSTQANTTNSYAISFYADMGIKRVVLARELSLEQIKRIRDRIPDGTELEAFVHGAMCMSYSGRCMLSNYLASRPSNRGECAQSCRWEYYVSEKTRGGEYMKICEDERGTYIFNSKDMNMLSHLDRIIDAGVTSLKIEGRIKSSYYVACVTNAYVRALNALSDGRKVSDEILLEPYKTSHRDFCTGFYFGNAEEYYLSSKPHQTYEMVARVMGEENGKYLVEMRNRFKVGEHVEILTPNENFNKTFKITSITDTDLNPITDAKNVQQLLYIESPYTLYKNDILRTKA